MYQRRDILKFVLGGLTAPAVVSEASAQAQAPVAPTPASDRFDPSEIVEMARALAAKPYKAPTSDLPDVFANLTYEQYAAIRLKPEKAIWAHSNFGFALEPLHRGSVFSTQMQINLVADGMVRTVPYDASRYDLGKIPPPADDKEIGFSGLRILRASDDGEFKELAIFQGASVFRSLTKGQTPGVMARGLSIRTADPKGEEFPLFRALWIERPSVATRTLVVHAVLDSESVAGAYRFTIRPGEATIIDIECTLFPRVALDHIGLGAMQAAYLYGPLDRRRGDDIRPAVYEASGLQMLNGAGEWLWRPLSNRETLQISAFVDQNPKGFGFLQRNRDFSAFQDDDQHWEKKPSLWIEPLADWGPGYVTLDEIPADSQVNQNMIAYWRPRGAIAAGAEASFAYRQFWCWNPPAKPPLATTRVSRSGRIPGAAANARRRRFLVEFAGDALASLANPGDISVRMAASPGTISNVRNFYVPERKAQRVIFDVDIGAEPMTELRMHLEAQGKPISETWLYRWTP
jgi:glucans biosynthesis protein